MQQQRKVILYIAMSLDGYIAGADGDLSFLDMVAQEGEDYGYSRFIKTVDTVIMGRKTYDKVLGMGIPYPHADKNSYILSRSQHSNAERLHWYNGPVKELIQKLQSEPGLDIFADGGADTVQQLLEAGLINELIVSVIPVLLGTGIPLFPPHSQPVRLALVAARSFPTGLVQLHYRKED